MANCGRWMAGFDRKQKPPMNKSHQGSSQSRHVRRFLVTTILPAALVVQAFGANWNGAVPLNTGDPGLDDIHVLGRSRS